MEKEKNAQENVRKSIMDMAGGAFKERADYELKKVIDNILDRNTDWRKKRKVTVTVTLTPTQEDRSMVNVSVEAKPTLAPVVPVTTTLGFTSDEYGCPILAEVRPQIPGQFDMDGNEEEEPAILKIARLG